MKLLVMYTKGKIQLTTKCQLCIAGSTAQSEFLHLVVFDVPMKALVNNGHVCIKVMLNAQGHFI